MGKRFDTLLFPGGKSKAFTLSYDDGVVQDRRLAEFMSGHGNQVWFASNGEIIDYVNAYRRLEYSADGLAIYNPSAVDVTIRTASEHAVLPAGKVTHLEPTPL